MTQQHDITQRVLTTEKRNEFIRRTSYISEADRDTRAAFVDEIVRAALASAPVADERQAVAYLDLGTGGYVDVGTDLTDKQLAALPKGRHMLAIIGTHGVDGYTTAALASAPVQWPTMPPSKGQSPVLFEDGYAEGWAKCMDECRRAVSQASAPVADEHCSASNPQVFSVEQLEKDPLLVARLWRKPADTDGSLVERIMEHVSEYGESMASSSLLSVRTIARRNLEARIEAELADAMRSQDESPLREALSEIASAWSARTRLPEEDGIQALKDIARAALASAPVAGEAQERIEQMAVNRYRPVPDGKFSYKVVAGDGSRSLYTGTKDSCLRVAAKLTEAFLDGAFVASDASPQSSKDGEHGE
ncbi:hypothetical protein [Achromobacter xylosoxidans]|uniref:hypothetical protein n=1 Tax=Alcaligenes xylosoxydans xylosoxydans TaxID=85698 RepID=UPI00047A332F|nr:hypothetical protein [Achromobacter xylosoxidans]